MNEKEFNGLILAELVKIANDVFTNEIEIAPGTYTAAELAKLEHLNITKLVTKDSLKPAFNYIYLDPYKSALVASNGRTLKEYLVIIETSGLLPDSLKLFINPKHLKEIAKRNKKSGFSLRTIAGDNKVYLSYNDADSNGHKELCATLEKAALIDIKLGFFASNVIPLLSGWTGGVWLVAPDRAVVFDDKMARIGVVMPAFILVLSGSNKQSITEANNVNRTIRHFFA